MKDTKLMPQHKYRLPEILRERLKMEARRNFRSNNAELVYQLSKAYGLGDEVAEYAEIQ